jgi:hypothetical protein
VSVAIEERLFLHASALSGPVLLVCVAYHLAAELLLLLDVSTSHFTALTKTKSIYTVCTNGVRR